MKRDQGFAALSYIWDFRRDHSRIRWLSIQHLLLTYWRVNISDQQLKSRCVCVVSLMHSTWNDLSLETELRMHSRLESYPAMFLVHSGGFSGAFSRLGPHSLTLWARGICRQNSLPSQCDSWKHKTNHHHILRHYYSHSNSLALTPPPPQFYYSLPSKDSVTL